MNHSDVARVFREAFNGQPNVLTPDAIDYGKKGRLIWELSRGSGFRTEHMYGVTVLTVDGERTELSQGGFTTEEEARGYIASLTLSESDNRTLT